jgi:hypothetical protein
LRIAGNVRVASASMFSGALTPLRRGNATSKKG